MATESKRMRQVAELIKRNFSVILQDEGTYIYGKQALVTVTDVRMTPDFGMAKIYLSVFNIEDKEAPVAALEESNHRLRQALGKRVRSMMRRIPEISFFLDDTLDEMFRIDAMFGRLYADNQMGDKEDDESSDDNDD